MKYSSRGLAGTIIFHISILLILIFFGFSYPDPPPEEQGVLVNFGTDLTGLGEVEPKGDETQGGEEETMPEVAEAVKIPVKETVKPKVKETAVVKNTQTLEDTKVKEKKPTEEELKEIERQKIQADELKKKKAEEERQRKLAAQWNTKGQNAFGKKGVGTTEESQGITEGTDNQGDPDGMPDVDNYGPGGGLGDGIKIDGLGDRGGNCPPPEGFTVSSKVVIKVQVIVDRNGNVVGEPQIIDSKFSDETINKAIIKAAKSAKFSVNPNAPYGQKGTIQYTIAPSNL